MSYNSKYTGAEVEGILDSVGGKQDAISDLDAIRSGANKGTTAYQKASTGIPKTDLASEVQASLVLADTALQSSDLEPLQADINSKATDSAVVHLSNTETITGAKTFNGGVNFLGSGDSNAVTLSTNTRINVNGTNQTVLGFGSGTFYINHANYNLLLRGKATRPTYNSSELVLSSDVNNKQDKLVSGSNIKTINGTSLLGSGDIEIQAGGGGSDMSPVGGVIPLWNVYNGETIGFDYLKPYDPDYEALIGNATYIFSEPLQKILRNEDAAGIISVSVYVGQAGTLTIGKATNIYDNNYTFTPITTEEVSAGVFPLEIWDYLNEGEYLAIGDVGDTASLHILQTYPNGFMGEWQDMVHWHGGSTQRSEFIIDAQFLLETPLYDNMNVVPWYNASALKRFYKK